jgi:DNA-directed RNA polymerase specialized sigma24 family protein
VHAGHRRRRVSSGPARTDQGGMSTLDHDVQSFESHRRALTGLAYRMLGSRAEAEDVVQDAYLRWHEADHAAIEQPRPISVPS